MITNIILFNFKVKLCTQAYVGQVYVSLFLISVCFVYFSFVCLQK